MSAPQAFVDAYLEALLWSEEPDRGSEDSWGDAIASNELREQSARDCDEFWSQAEPLLDEWSWDQAGHDFALTRNHHGTGYWDRDLPNGDELTKLAHAAGEVWVYAGDDGFLYLG